MTQKTKLFAFVALLGLLAVVVYRNLLSSPEIGAVLLADVKFTPLAVENPSLRMDKLDQIKKTEYTGGGRNIFDRTPPPPPPVERPQQAQAGGPTMPPPPPPEQPLNVPFKYYGLVTDTRTGKRRACFTNGEEVWIVSEGELIQARFKLLRFGNTSAELEEASSGKKATLPIEEIPQGAAPG